MSRARGTDAPPTRFQLTVWALLCGALAGLLYAPAVDGEFVWDDFLLIVDNPAGLDEWSDAARAFVEPGLVGSSIAYYRPLLVASYVADGRASGKRPHVFHRTNVVIHGVNTALVWWLLWVLIGRRVAASFGSLLFAVHPIQGQAVALITGRNDLLLLAPFVLAIIAHRAWSRADGARRTWLGVLLLALYALVLWTKETGVLLPLLLVGDLVLVRRDHPRGTRAGGWLLAGMALVAGAYFLTRWSIFGSLVGAAPAEVVAWGERLRNVIAVLGYYTQHVALPFGYAATPYHPGLARIDAPTFLIAVGWCLALVAAVVVAWRRRPPVAFGLLWFVIVLFPVLGLVPMVLAILEHRVYVPMAGVVVAAASLLAAAARRHRTITLTVAGLVLVALAAATRARIPVYRDPISLWSWTVEQAPSSAYARYSYGFALVRLGRDVEALEQYEQAIALNPRHRDARLELGLVLVRANRVREAIGHFAELVRRHPDFGKGWNALGAARARIGEIEGARAALERGLGHDPQNPMLLSNLGRLEEGRGNVPRAVELYRRLVVVEPQVAIHWSRLARALSRAGVEDEAAAARRRAAELEASAPGH